MAITKTAAQILTAAQTLAAVAGGAGNPQNKGSLLSDLRYVFEHARVQYKCEYTAIVGVTITDTAQANLAALWAAKTELVDGCAFRVTGTGDTTDNALEAAKGSAVVAGDVFNRSGSAVAFVGVAANVPADVTSLTDTLKA